MWLGCKEHIYDAQMRLFKLVRRICCFVLHSNVHSNVVISFHRLFVLGCRENILWCPNEILLLLLRLLLDIAKRFTELEKATETQGALGKKSGVLGLERNGISEYKECSSSSWFAASSKISLHPDKGILRASSWKGYPRMKLLVAGYWRRVLNLFLPLHM